MWTVSGNCIRASLENLNQHKMDFYHSQLLTAFFPPLPKLTTLFFFVVVLCSDLSLISHPTIQTSCGKYLSSKYTDQLPWLCRNVAKRNKDFFPAVKIFTFEKNLIYQICEKSHYSQRISLNSNAVSVRLGIPIKED